MMITEDGYDDGGGYSGSGGDCGGDETEDNKIKADDDDVSQRRLSSGEHVQ